MYIQLENGQMALKEIPDLAVAKVHTMKDLIEFVELGGWDDVLSFLHEHGVDFEEIKDTWFQTSHGRLFLFSDQEVKDMLSDDDYMGPG
jgi:hypothetical protein